MKMKRTLRSSLRLGIVLAVLGATVMAGTQGASSAASKTVIPVKSWLVAGPLAVPLPAFSGTGDRPFGVPDGLKFEPVEVRSLRPRAGGALLWVDGTKAPWRALAAGDKGVELTPTGAAFETAYLAAFIDAARWVPAKVSFTATQPFQAYLDGRLIASSPKADKRDTATAASNGRVSADLKLETGEHLLIIRGVYDRSAGTPWLMGAALEVDERFGPEALTLPAARDRDRLSITLLLDGPKPMRVAISPDGAYVALSFRQSLPPSGDSESWAEIYRVGDGALVRSVRWPGATGSVEWTGDGRKFSTTTSDKSGGTIWLGDLDDGSLKPILAGVPKLGEHTWAHDGSFLVYGVSEDAPKDIDGVKRLRGLVDREPGFRSRTALYRLSPSGGARERLTAGELSTRLDDISPDNKKLLVSRTIEDPTARPYEQTELSILDLGTLEAKIVWKGSWLNSAEWSPDGKSLLMLGGPSLFGDLGVKVRKGTIPNEYDVQAYLYDLETRRAAPLTRDFDPSVDRAFFGPEGDVIYLLTTDRAARHLYRCRLSDQTFTLIPCGAEVIEQLSIARRGRGAAAVIASEPNEPSRAFTVDLDSGSVRLLRDAGAEAGDQSLHRRLVQLRLAHPRQVRADQVENFLEVRPGGVLGFGLCP
jgi:hypothetical protein